MKHTGDVKLIQGRKLYELEGGFYEDDTGKKFSYEYGKLYEERRPGVWYWLREKARPQPDFADHLLRQAEGDRNDF